MTEALLLLPDFLLILVGFLLCRYTPLNRPLWEGLERLVYLVLFPVLLFTAILRNPLSLTAEWPLVMSALVLMASGIAMGVLLGRWPGVPAPLHASGAQTAFRFNSYVALALADRLAGPAGVACMAVVISVSVPLANVAAVWPLARHTGRGVGAELVRNPLIIATVAGLLCNALGFRLTTTLETLGSRMGAAALALGLMAVGAGLRVGALGEAPRLAASLLAVRHLFLPALALAVVLPWAGLPPQQQLIITAFSAMPTASSAYVLAVRMGGRADYVAGLVTLSTLLAMVGLPISLALLRTFGPG